MRKRQTADLAKLTLADMFAEEPQLKAMFSGTAAFVGSQATVADAKSAMTRWSRCLGGSQM